MYENLPKRIVCLTEETTETLYSIGAEELIVGITQFVKRPKRARKEKPVVSRYIDAKIDKILELEPDLILAWSDMQADICAELIRAGQNVMCFNHCTIADTLKFIEQLGAIIGKYEDALEFANSIRAKLEIAREKGAQRKLKPRVYFEEWDEPIITGITWVSELIELCGGTDVYSDLSFKYHAKERILDSPDRVLERDSDIMLASWCGKKFKKETVLNRNSWHELTFVKNDEIHELPSEIILQPGPAALTDGVDLLMDIFDKWESRQK